ncbi:hypothetical protein HDV04_000103 [Boothiomyces sp. JEL0838]|nr:hypothetical protein HDV04_000103 [Boothiomyces sp. JEL0838]
MNCLILGDGNFSFSLALAQLLKNPASHAYDLFKFSSKPKNIQLICTSFDSHSELLDKYGDAEEILEKLSHFKNVQIMHEINAWELSNHFNDKKFDVIIWNHPHLGTEDFRLHQFLMAHFFHSAASVLEPESIVQISLVQGQEVRWNVHTQAARSQLNIKSIELFNELQWPGYVVKRNKHGGSFKNVHTRRHVRTTMKSCVHTFGFGESTIPIENVHSLLESIFGNSFDSTFDQKPVIDPKGDLTPAKVTKGRKKKEYPADLICVHCKKELTSPRAYHQHVHMVHELQQFGENWVPNRPKTVKCAVSGCDKSFADDEALKQHLINKHTQIDTSELPESPDAKYSTTKNDSDYDYVPCEVCGQSCIKQPWGKELHLESLKPALGLRMKCPLCPGEFIEQRALYQHFKFCKAKHASK